MRVFALGTVALVMLGTGCWKEPRPAQPSQPVPVAVLPDAATVTVNHLFPFAARIDGLPAGEVTWGVAQAAGGSIDAQGRYRAPAAPGSYTVLAQWKGAPERRAEARVTVVAPPAGDIQVTPHILAGASDLRASVPAVAGNRYAWTLTGGLITAGIDAPAMTFQAGAGPTLSLGCKVSNAAGDALQSSLEVKLVPAVALTVKPEAVTLSAGRGFKFGYEISGGNTLGVTWSLGEPGAGRLDAGGHYVAPMAPGLYTVRVTSVDDPARFAITRVTVVPAPPEGLFVQSSFVPGGEGLRASVPEAEGMTYAWEIVGGTLTAGADSSAVLFTAGPGPQLTLRCRIRNQAGDTQTSERTLKAR